MKSFNISSLIVCFKSLWNVVKTQHLECCMQPIFRMLHTANIWNVVYTNYMECCVQPIFEMLYTANIWNVTYHIIPRPYVVDSSEDDVYLGQNMHHSRYGTPSLFPPTNQHLRPEPHSHHSTPSHRKSVRSTKGAKSSGESSRFAN